MSHVKVWILLAALMVASAVHAVKVTWQGAGGFDNSFTLVDGTELTKGSDVEEGSVILIKLTEDPTLNVSYNYAVTDCHVDELSGSTTKQRPDLVKTGDLEYSYTVKDYNKAHRDSIVAGLCKVKCTDDSVHNVKITFITHRFVKISSAVIGEGSVEIVPGSEDYATHDFDGETYYFLSNSPSFTFNVKPSDGYYLSSASVKNTDGTVNSAAKIAYNQSKQTLTVSNVYRHFTLETEFKQLDNSIINEIDERCEVEGLPASAEYKTKVSFTVNCKDDSYAVVSVSKTCSDENDTTCSSKPFSAQNGVFSFVKNSSAVTIRSNVGYKVTLMDDSTSFSSSYTRDENGVISGLTKEKYVAEGSSFFIYAFTVDGGSIDSATYDYDLVTKDESSGTVTTPIHVKKDFYEVSCSGTRDLNCRYTSLAMPSAPIEVNVYRHIIDYKIDADFGDYCESEDLPKTAHANEVVTFTLKCEDGYSVEKLHYSGFRTSGDVVEEDGKFSFVMPMYDIKFGKPAMRLSLSLLDKENISVEVYPEGDLTATPSTEPYAYENDSVRVLMKEIAGYEIAGAEYSNNGFTPYLSANGSMVVSYNTARTESCEDGICKSKLIAMGNRPLTIRMGLNEILYEVVASDDDHCKLKSVPSNAYFNKNVNFSVGCDEGYEADVSLTSENGTCPELEGTEEGYSFVQPAFEVSVVVKSSKIVKEESSSSVEESSSSAASSSSAKENASSSSVNSSSSIVAASSSSSAASSSSNVASSSSVVASSSSAKVDASSSSVAESSCSAETVSSSSEDRADGSGSGESSSSKDDAPVIAQRLIPAFQISVAGRSIMISGVAANVAVFDMQGRVLKTATMNSSLTMDMPGPGRYMVKVGGITKVVNVR